jgi:hypothetical protein
MRRVRPQSTEPQRLALAPLFGVLAGFLLNRARDGGAGWALLLDMALAALLLTAAAVYVEAARRAASRREAIQDSPQAAQAAEAERTAALTRFYAKLLRAMQRREEGEVLALGVSDSTRARNLAADGEQSGRLFELEARVRRLKRELECATSARSAAAQPTGEASLVALGGTQDAAKTGFLRGMLEANKSLRRLPASAA